MQGLFIKSPILKIILGILASLGMFAFVLVVLFTEDARMEVQTLNWEGRSIENGAALFKNNCTTCHGEDGKGLPAVAPALNSHYFFTRRIKDVKFAGSLEQYIKLTVASGRPSKKNSQWAQEMPTWSHRYGGPFRDDQVNDVVKFVLNWEKTALEQTAEEDPWQCFQDVPVPCEQQTIAAVEGEAAPPAEEAPKETAGPRDPADIFATLGCGGCHTLAGVPGAVGTVGPDLTKLATEAGSRVEGMSAEEYVRESIVNPNAYIVEGYPSGVMPQNFGEKLSEEELNNLVDWILNPDQRGQ